MHNERLGVFGGGLAGCCIALALARRGVNVDLIERSGDIMRGASLHNEGKLHLGYVYAADKQGLTHELMARGSLTFPGIIEHLTGFAAVDIRTSSPFMYAVPNDSQLDASEVERHFRNVDATIARLMAEGGPFMPTESLDPARRLTEAELQGRLGLDAIQAGFQTGELSVDTKQVADLLRQAIHASERIRVYLDCEVLSASHTEGGGVQVKCRHEDKPVEMHYRYGINCTWEDRLRLDATLGLRPERPWLMRYKAAMTLHLRHPAAALELPSITLITGPYGDIVNHDGRKIYVSWYPLCKLAETRDVDGLALHDIAHAKCPPDLVEDSVQALARFVPGLAEAARDPESVRIGGGVIFAWGQTDIDDPKSGLHERHAIGATFNKDWASMDTGKYCMAPYYAVALADTIISRIKPHDAAGLLSHSSL